MPAYIHRHDEQSDSILCEANEKVTAMAKILGFWRALSVIAPLLASFAYRVTLEAQMHEMSKSGLGCGPLLEVGQKT